MSIGFANMKRKYFIIIAVFAAVLFGLSMLAFADGDFYVNDSSHVLPQFFDGVYAVGGEGTELLFSDQVYALSGSGLQLLGSAGSNGGGGLLYEDGTVTIRSESVRVGLFYSYSESRDSALDSSVLENKTGCGFAFGYQQEDGGTFIELARTDESRILVTPGTDSAVYVSGGTSEEPICGLDGTGRSRYLIVQPLSDGEAPLTSCAGNTYYGDFAYAVLANNRLTVVNIVDMEHYVMGVCAREMTESWPVEALKAQAVAARTYAQKMIRTSVYHYICGFDVTADTYCQAYRGIRGVGENIIEAVQATRNEYLTSGKLLIDAVYSASDGGATEDGQNVFGYASSYLVGVSDPYESAADRENPYSSWKVTMTPAQLGAKVGLDSIREVVPTLSRTGNVIKLELWSVSGRSATLIRDNCRTSLGLKNIRYCVSKDASGNFVFEGSGFGHNLGMSQWGAYAMAKYYEKDYRFILGFYFTKVGLSRGVLE